MAASASGNALELLRVEPGELQFLFESGQQLMCRLKLANDTKYYVAFKVKTTAPKNYCVSPSTGVLQPRSTLEVIVSMRAQHQVPADGQSGQSKDKFLMQSVVVPDEFLASDINQEMFTKDLGNEIFETKLRVSFAFPEKDTDAETVHDASYFKERIQEVNAALTTVLEERNAAGALSERLQQELASLTANTKRSAAPSAGYSLLVVFLAGLLGIVIGFLLTS